jgi:hypothetical protein
MPLGRSWEDKMSREDAPFSCCSRTRCRLPWNAQRFVGGGRSHCSPEPIQRPTLRIAEGGPASRKGRNPMRFARTTAKCRSTSPFSQVVAPITPRRPVGQAPVTGANDPNRQSRSVDRDIGFDDAFATQGNAVQGGGATGANANAGAGPNPGGAAAASANVEARRAPASRR